MSTVFVVFEGTFGREYKNPAGVFSAEPIAKQVFDDFISKGFVDSNIGLYLGRIDGLDEDGESDVYENTATLADKMFEGYELTIIDSRVSQIGDWHPDALTVEDDDFNDSEEDFAVSSLV